MSTRRESGQKRLEKIGTAGTVLECGGHQSRKSGFMRSCRMRMPRSRTGWSGWRARTRRGAGLWPVLFVPAQCERLCLEPQTDPPHLLRTGTEPAHQVEEAAVTGDTGTAGRAGMSERDVVYGLHGRPARRRALVQDTERAMVLNTSAGNCKPGRISAALGCPISSPASHSRTPMSNATIGRSAGNGSASSSGTQSRRSRITPRVGYGLTTTSARTRASAE